MSIMNQFIIPIFRRKCKNYFPEKGNSLRLRSNRILVPIFIMPFFPLFVVPSPQFKSCDLLTQ